MDRVVLLMSLCFSSVLHFSVVRGQELPVAYSGTVDFAKDILPILRDRCWSCHSAEKQESGLRLDRRDLMLTGGDLGRVVEPGRSDASRLIHYVAAVNPENVMPPDGEALLPAEVGLLRAWIDQNCSWPSSVGSPAELPPHWAYQPIQRETPPTVHATSWPRNEIDHFILAELEQHALSPSNEASRETLIRRLSLDLTGLLPTIEEVDAFVSDRDPRAYEKQVDRLLASPHFGERWGRHWLDMARYADSDGYEKDNPRPDAFRWRDWVIDAINEDMPFDQFTIEQIAGDLLPNATLMQKLATAFHRQTLTNTEGGTDQEQFRVEACFDRTETTGTVWLGLTIGCARCHTHKYDAITQREYYQLFSVFNNGDESTVAIPEPQADADAWQRLKTAHDSRVAELQKELKDAEERKLDSVKTLTKQLADLRKQAPPKPEIVARVITQRVKEPRVTYVLKRGEFLDPVKELEVKPAALSVLPPMAGRENGQSADRLDLARWLVSPENPLPPRVTVNHVWRLLFGHGLVRTPNDFGVRGEKPTHPQLLDWLAAEFMNGSGEDRPWSRKALIRRIVLSATYRQSSRHRPELLETDPQNLLLARQNRLRVEAEIIRDISLDAAGLLSRKIGGPSVYPPLPPGIAELSYAGNFKWPESTGEDRFRRGMYTFFKRTSPHPNLMTFDCPDANITCIERQASNTPLQALTSLNNDSFSEAARAFAKRVLLLPDSDSDIEGRLAIAFRICMARAGSAVELNELQALLKDSQNWYGSNPDQAKTLIGEYKVDGVSPEINAAWISTCRVLLNLDEFITRE